MILKSSFGTFTPPQILAEALRQSLREMVVLSYDIKELTEFIHKVLENPETWLGEPPKTFSLNDFFEAYHGEKR